MYVHVTNPPGDNAGMFYSFFFFFVVLSPGWVGSCAGEGGGINGGDSSPS